MGPNRSPSLQIDLLVDNKVLPTRLISYVCWSISAAEVVKRRGDEMSFKLKKKKF